MSKRQPQIIKTSWLKFIAITLFLTVIGVAEYLIRDYQSYQKYQAERSAVELAIRIKSQLETELHGATFLTHGIEAYVVARNGNIIPEEINSMLQQVYQFSPYFRNIGIAPNNVLRWVMPVKGNEAAIGLRYNELPSQWPSIKETIDSKEAKLHGPLELVQGDLGIIYRSPLYIDGTYWGLISAVIDAESLFQSLIKEVGEAGTPVRLGLKHIDNRENSDGIFLGDSSIFNSAEVTTNVDVPGGEWQLAIISDDVLPNLWPVRILVWCLTFLGILGLFYLIRQIYQRRLLNSLATEVQLRTKEVTAVNNKLNHVLNAASETAIIATDKNGLINVFNRGAERMLGYSAEEVVNKETPAIFHDPDEVKEKGEWLTQKLNKATSGFSVFTAIPDIEGSEKDNWTYISKAGQRIPVELTVTREFDNNGNAVGYLGLASNISRQIQDQQALQELKERLESATRVANLGVWELNLNNKGMLWNKQMHELTGVASEHFDSHYSSMEKVFYPQERQEFNEFLARLTEKANNKQAFLEDPPPLETTFPITKNDTGELRWLKGHAVIQCNEMGVPESMLGTVLDISELVFAREVAEQAEKLKSQFLSTVSHELRTPLSVISGALSLMSLESEKFSEDTQNVLDLASRNSQRLTLLINDLLDIEKMTSGKVSLKIRQFEISELVQKAIAENQEYARQHGAEIQLGNHFSASLIVAVDELRFMQVLTNLLSNAAKFCPDGDIIQVKISARENKVFIDVIDHGTGIPESFQEKVFEPFSQAESSDSRAKGGTGLGLAITKTIVEQMGGAVGFESKANEKTRFWFSLPIVGADSPPGQDNLSSGEEQTEGVSSSTDRFSKNKVLHVEDYDDFSTVITAILKDKYNIDTAKTVVEAKRKLKEQTYDIVILDIALPDGSGWEVVETARCFSKGVKIIVTSDYEVASKKAKKVDAVMSKAVFTRAQFIELVDRLSGR